MSIKYKFIVDGTERHPHWGEGLSKEYELESEQQFFRTKLSGSLVFVKSDYDYLAGQPFNTEFELLIQYYVNGAWENYFTGYFTKADCKWDSDNKRAEVSILPRDEYTEILAKMEYEYNAIELTPVLTPITYLRRPILQAYLPGDTVVASFLGGMYWEQEVVLPEPSETVLEDDYYFARGATFQQIVVENIDSNFDLSDNYVQERDFDGSVFTEALEAFGENEQYKIVEVAAAVKATCAVDIINTPTVTGVITITYPASSGDPNDQITVAVAGGSSASVFGNNIADTINADSLIGITCTYNSANESLTFKAKVGGTIENGNEVSLNTAGTGASFSPPQPIMTGGANDGFQYELLLAGGTQALFRSEAFLNPIVDGTYQLDAVPFSGSLTTGSLLASSAQLNFYTRILTNGPLFGPTPAFPLPAEDLIAENRNYSTAAPVGVDAFTITNKSSVTPTEYGLRPDGKYYAAPNANYFPSGRNGWDLSSVWFNYSAINVYDTFADSYTLKDTYKVSDILSALLSEIDPTISHGTTAAYSEFLYASSNPINDTEFTLMLTQKSNVLIGGYDQPATRAPIKLVDILTMLRDCYKLYWFIEDGNFRIEHIKWFRNGGSYDVAPVVGVDLTTVNEPRSGRPWAFQTSNWSYKKEDLAERIEFSWMDESTSAFSGEPIEVVSNYVNRGNIDNVNIPKFTSDIDFILAAPENISRDGFVLFAATLDGSSYELPIVSLLSGGRLLNLQNAYASFIWLQEEYMIWDLPARTVVLNGTEIQASGVLRNKKQKVIFPSVEDPVLFDLIKTYIGNGEIEKLSINLSSRMCTADLRYDTDE